MNTDTLVREIAGKIQTKIAEGSEALKNPVLREKINHELRHQDEEMLRMGSTELMSDFVKMLINICPRPGGWDFEEIEKNLISLREIRALLTSIELNKHVQIFNDSEVMKERRIPLIHFKKDLFQELFLREKSEHD